MNFKSFLKALGHAALGGATTALANVPAGAPITAGNFLAPMLLGGLTSIYSAASDASQANPLVHAAIGAAPVLVYTLSTGDHSAVQALLPALVSGLTSAISAQSPNPLALTAGK